MPRADAGCERAIHHLTVGRLGREDPATILLTRLMWEMAGKLPGRRTRMMNRSLRKSTQWMEVCSDLGSAFFLTYAVWHPAWELLYDARRHV